MIGTPLKTADDQEVPVAGHEAVGPGRERGGQDPIVVRIPADRVLQGSRKTSSSV